MIHVAIIEDNRLVRDGLTLRLNEQPDFKVSYCAANGSIEELRTSSSQVLLLDVGLEEEDSLHVAERVRTELPAVRIIVVDLLPVHEDLVEFVTTGVAGFILKDATLEDLLTTIRSVAAGQTVLPPQMTSTLFSQIVGEAVQRGLAGVNEATGLTPREHKVVARAAGRRPQGREVALRRPGAAQAVPGTRLVVEGAGPHRARCCVDPLPCPG